MATAPTSPSISSLVPMIDPRSVVSAGFALIFIVWAIYTFVVFYHWLRYGHQSWAAVPALALHLLVTASILIFMVSGFH